MRRAWLAWLLPALLVAGVVVGLALERPVVGDPERSGNPTKTADTAEDGSPPRPQFDCDQRSDTAYDLSPKSRKRHVTWLTEELDLSERQVASMHTVFADASYRAEEFWREARDRYCELREEFYADIRGVLDDGQEAELDEKLRERKEQSERLKTLESRTGDAVSKRP